MVDTVYIVTVCMTGAAPIAGVYASLSGAKEKIQQHANFLLAKAGRADLTATVTYAFDDSINLHSAFTPIEPGSMESRLFAHISVHQVHYK